GVHEPGGRVPQAHPQRHRQGEHGPGGVTGPGSRERAGAGRDARALKNALTIARKELRVYFVSPLFYVVTALFVALSSFFFAANLIQSNQASMRTTFNATLVVMLF